MVFGTWSGTPDYGGAPTLSAEPDDIAARRQVDERKAHPERCTCKKMKTAESSQSNGQEKNLKELL